MSKMQVATQEILSHGEWDYYLSRDPFKYLQSIQHSLINENRFFVDERFLKLIYTYTKNGVISQNSEKYLLPHEDILYRARIYCESDARERIENSEKYGLFQGYNKEKSFVPPANLHINEGRLNPTNIRYLYASSDPETCLLEVRPKPEDYVSIAKIQVNEPLKLFSLSFHGLALWEISDEYERRIENWSINFFFGLMDIFHRPYKETGDYLLCQYISEYLKNLEYDGIEYTSSIDRLLQRKNYTIFNYDKCEVVSSKLYEVNSVSIITNPKLT